MEQAVPNTAAGTDCCPYWSLQDRSCLLGDGGLHLPVVEHVELYCQREVYSSCPYYIEKTEKNIKFRRLELSDSRVDCRRYQRVSARFPIYLFSSVAKVSSCIPDSMAITVDFSQGGFVLSLITLLTKELRCFCLRVMIPVPLLFSAAAM